MKPPNALLRTLLLAIGLGSAPQGTGADPGAPGVATLSRSVGQLLVPAIRYEKGHARHYQEHCSATLVADGEQSTSRLLLSAWHCLEDHRDLSRPVLFLTGAGERLPVQAIASGGAMHADWILLRLPRALPGPLSLRRYTAHSGGPVHLAGFPRQASPRSLTLRSGCRITGQDGKDLRTDCVIQKGASGGAALSHAGLPQFLGVISRGDGLTQSIFVPVSRFYARIRPFLAGDLNSGRAE